MADKNSANSDNNNTKNPSRTNCCVVGCSNGRHNNPSVSLYRFPTEILHRERRAKWVAAVKRLTHDGQPWQPSKNTRICSAHFYGNKKVDIADHPSYLPTIFPPIYKKRGTDAATQSAAKRCARLQTRHRRKESLGETSGVGVSRNYKRGRSTCQSGHAGGDSEPITTPLLLLDETTNEKTITDNFLEPDNPEHVVEETSASFHNTSSKVNICTQTDISSRCFCNRSQVERVDVACGPNNPFESNVPITNGFIGYNSITSGHLMNQLAGVTLKVFAILLTYIKPNEPGNPAEFRKVRKENRLLIFLMRLKLGLTYGAIGCLFSISSRTASNIFYQCLEALLVNVKDWVYWPSKFAVRECLPKSFGNYPNCRVIIDCTEIRCDTPTTVEQRVLMYSQYKGWFTVKVLTGITPNGFISFLSNAYGGRATDGFITVNSGFLKKIEPGDLVMADKGFPQILTELEKQDAILVMPPFLTNPQFSEKEVDDTYRIASVRIHVERCIQRIKTYRILDHVTRDMLPKIDDILRICCVLTNMKPPLIAETDAE